MCGMTEARHDLLPAADSPRIRAAQRSDLRAADADRDRAAAQLGGALAVGRLTSTEYAERLDAVYAARTLGELAPLTRDLPDDATENGEDADGPVIRLVGDARFSKVVVHRRRPSRGGAWHPWSDLQHWHDLHQLR